MKIELTESECFREAGKLYKGYLTIDKAIKFLKFENEWDVSIREDKNININREFCIFHDINPEHMIFMKRLQESGEVNMMTESKPVISQRLLIDSREAQTLLLNYITYYNEIFYPNKCI